MILAIADGGCVLIPDTPVAGDHVSFLRSCPDGTVLLVAAAGARDLHEVVNRLCRIGIAPGVRVQACDLPVTVFALVHEVLRTGAFGVGDCFEVMRMLRSMATTVAVLSSVAKLVSPSPSLPQHLRGWLPGAAFLVDVSSNRIQSYRRRRGPSDQVHRAGAAVAAAADPTSQGWQRTLATLSSSAVVEVGTVDPDALTWRSPRWAEYTGLPAGIDETTAVIMAHLDRRDCASCGRPVAGGLCPVCGVVVGPAADLVVGTRRTRQPRGRS